MAEWGKVYQLRGDVTLADVWNCIVCLLQRIPGHGAHLPKGSPPRHFFWQDATSLCRWIEDDEWAAFDFAGTTDGSKTTLQIIFSKKEKSCGTQKVHPLSFYEKTTGSQHLCPDLFDLVKENKLVPKKQTQSQVKRIEHLRKRFKNSEDLKILFSDNREGKLLEQVEKVAERLWFLGAEFYTCDELDFMGLWEDEDPEIRKFKEDLSPKFKRQLDSKDRRARMMDMLSEFEPFKHMLSPTIAVICNDRMEKLSLDDTDSGAEVIPISRIIDMAFNLTIDNFGEERTLEFKDFLDKYDGKDIFDIQREAELQAMFRFAVEHSLKQIETAKQPQPQAAAREGETNPSRRTEEDGATSGPMASPEESDSRLKELKEQNAQLKAEIERLKAENDGLEAEQKKLQQKNSDLQEQLDRKKVARTQRQNEERKGLIRLEIPCAEDNLFPNEIEDYLFALLYWALGQEKKSLPDNRHKEVSRKRDVIEVVLNSKTFSWDETETCKNLSDKEKAFKDDAPPSSAGFTKVSENNHEKYYFVQERYQITFALSPSDNKMGRGVQNKMKEIKGRLFLMPPGTADSGEQTAP